MPNYENIIDSHEKGVLTITINRSEKLNALDSITLAELKHCIEKSYDNKNVKGLIITGSGNKAFVAGADISEFDQLNELNGRKYSERGQEIFALIENPPKPLIAVINGFVLGGGCELACHMRVASENAYFGPSRGKVANFISIRRHPKAFSNSWQRKTTKDLLYTIFQNASLSIGMLINCVNASFS